VNDIRLASHRPPFFPALQPRNQQLNLLFLRPLVILQFALLPPTVRQETKQQSTTTRKSGTKVSLTTKSPVLNVPNSHSKAATNGVRRIVINDDVIIEKAISDITSQLEEIKREAEIIQQK
jgi:hypothetical protein